MSRHCGIDDEGQGVWFSKIFRAAIDRFRHIEARRSYTEGANGNAPSERVWEGVGTAGYAFPAPGDAFVSPSRPPLHYDYTNIKVYSVFTACREVSGSNIEFIIRVCIEKPRVFILRLLFLSVNALRYMLTLSSQPNRYTLYQHLNILASTSSN